MISKDRLIIPVIWLGRYLEKPFHHSIPENDNMWKFGTGPDTMRKILSGQL
jgi:hypothetical protein